MVDRIIKNGNKGNRNLLSSTMANGTTNMPIKTRIIIQFALTCFSFWSIGLKENKIPNGIKINKYGYKILNKTLNKFVNPFANLSINPRTPCFSTNDVTVTDVTKTLPSLSSL